jgi:hypothetical protein
LWVVILVGVWGAFGASLVVRWTDQSANESGFRVEKSPDGETAWLPIAVTANNVEEYVDASLAPGETRFYRVRSYNSVGVSVPSNVASGTALDVPNPPGGANVVVMIPAGKLDALSSRQRYDGTALIFGVNVSGAPVRALIRAVGPTLAQFPVANPLPDPRIQVVGGAANDDWGGTGELAAAFASVGLFALPVGSKDAALIVELSPGLHTVHVTAPAGQSGEVLLEVYQLP